LPNAPNWERDYAMQIKDLELADRTFSRVPEMSAAYHTASGWICTWIAIPVIPTEARRQPSAVEGPCAPRERCLPAIWSSRPKQAIAQAMTCAAEGPCAPRKGKGERGLTQSPLSPWRATALPASNASARTSPSAVASSGRLSPLQAFACAGGRACSSVRSCMHSQSGSNR